MNLQLLITGKGVNRLLILTALTLQLTTFSHSVVAQSEPSREPVLRIEAGMHTGVIRALGVDAANRFFVTAGDDKTIRVWEAPAGRLLRVIRPPIGTGFEGKIYSLAVSPDGQEIVAGGSFGFEWDRNSNIYFFSRDSGRLVRRIQGLPEIVLSLAYSRDGRYVAATLGGKNGMRVYDAQSHLLVGSDQDYGNSSLSTDFDSSGHFVTSSLDGFVRLYEIRDSSCRLLRKSRAAGGNQPEAAVFSPDDLTVAVGFYDSTRVNVLSAKDLSLIDSPDTSSLTDCEFSQLAWSKDGKTLYGGGSCKTAQGNVIRKWSNGGRDKPKNAVAAANLITHIVSLLDGGVAYISAEPAIGIIDSLGMKRLFIGPVTPNFTAGQNQFLVSSDGGTVQFAYAYGGASTATFSLSTRVFESRSRSGEDLKSPITSDAAIRITDWEYTSAANLNGNRLQLPEREISTGLAIAPNGQQFVLGTTGFVRLFDKKGTELWHIEGPGVTLAVNLSADGRKAIAAFSDGTIRWYRITDGNELIAFFPHADRKRWVLWTPSGYYDASPGGEELIGWHVNNGKDQAADFFPVGQFRSTYYRPDVISKILETGDEARALQLANEERGRKAQTSSVAQMLPPVVEIASPSDNSEVSASEVTIRYSLRTPSGEAVTNVRALVDGRPATGNRQLTREEASASGVRELKISVPERDSEVSIIAENKFAASVPAMIRLKWRASTPSADTFVIQPKLYVLAIGVSQYQNPSYSLKFAAKDAQDFAAAATIQKGLLYRDVVVKVLTNEHATKDEILDGLDWIRKETTSKDVAMVFFAGHGLNDQNGVYYFLPYNTDLEKLLRTGVPFTDIKNTVQSLAGKTLFFIDTCHSGNVLGGRRGLADDLNGIINELASAESGAVVFAASTGNQYSLEDAKWNNGAFTKALVEGFTGRADYSGKGRITINMLDLYISERVKELTGGKQTPTTAKPNTIQDFPIAVKR